MVMVFRLDCKTENIEAFAYLAAVLRADGVVCLPSDTCYGLSCLASSTKATLKLKQIKGRDAAKPFILIVRDTATAMSYSKAWSREASLIAKAFWPGPLSIVVPFRQSESHPIAHTCGTIAVRAPDSDVLREIMRIVDSPLWSTSANTSGRPAPATIDEIPADVLASVDVIVDVGELPRPCPSTIVDLSTKKTIILREGPVKAQDIALAVAITLAGHNACS